MHLASRGVPRLVNQICDYALVYAFTDGLEDLLLCPRTLAVHPPLFDQIARQLATSAASGHLTQVSTAIADLLVSGPVRSRTDDDATFLAIRFDETMP